MALRKFAHGVEKSRFPGEGRDPFHRHSELLKQSQWLASEDGLVPRKDGPRLSPGKRLK
jgi:hypothetical protein